MSMKRINNQAQNFVEYTLILGMVGVALFSMQAYFKRGIQSVVKVVADDLGPQGEPLHRNYLNDPQKYQEKIEDGKKIEAAIKAHYGYENKYFYESNYIEEVTTENQGEGIIVRTTNSGETKSRDISY